MEDYSDIPMKKKVAKGSGKITLRTLLTHMQGMKEELKSDISNIKTDTNGIKIRLDRLETRFDRLETKVDHGFAQIGAQLDTIDTRLDDIEIIPSITKHLSRRT